MALAQHHWAQAGATVIEHLAQFRTYFCWLSMGFGSPWLHRVT